MEWYQKTKEQLLEEFHITSEGMPAEQAEEVRKTSGWNVLQEEKKIGLWRVFFNQFADVLVIILVAAASISLFSGNIESTIVIFVVIFMNAVLGTVQYKKAEKSLESLKSLSSPNARIIREGEKIQLPAKEIVPGDLVILEAGDVVPADGRVLESHTLQVNESSLTGESLPVEKFGTTIHKVTTLAERYNMVYAGSLVTYGRGEVLITEIGMKTELGKIASLMNLTKNKKTPLQISLDQFSKKLALVVLFVCLFVFGLSIYRKMEILDAMMFAVALAVAAIPEALGSIVTIVQAMGTQKMAKQNAIIKDLKAVETLGSVSVICSDKTGTLTQNKMKVQDIYLNHKLIKPEDLDLKNPLHRYLLYDCILTNDARIVDDKKIGDPTESSLLELGQNVDLNIDLIRNLMKRLGELPFDSDRKRMSTLYELHGVPTLLTKGAIDSLLELSTHVKTEEGIRELNEQDKEDILKANEALSMKGLRVLAFAYKEVGEEEEIKIEMENEFIFIGFVSMMDPPRVESIQAVADAKSAGIKTVMITGDHKITATAIAQQIGIFVEGDLAITGEELDQLSEEELKKKIRQISVYARVSPENKIRIVECWQSLGHIVSMTGDGVNDAPALKMADIGVAMGITGTEVSKDAASMILMDDNFATIIKAVANGRNVYRNIKNAIKFLFSGNIAGILVVLVASIGGLPLPFAPVHLLFMNLLTDSLPALAIGMEPASSELLKERPRDPKEGILTASFMINVLLQGGLIACGTLLAFGIGLKVNALTASTMAFYTLTIARLFHGFNCRNDQSIFKIGLLSNLYSVEAFFAGMCLVGVVMFVPILRGVLLVSELTVMNYVWVLIIAIIPTAIIQIVKYIKGLK